jgi:hypothetical protein
MRGRLLLLVVALGLSAMGLAQTTRAGDCEECVEYCSTIPMDPQECLELYCPGCASASLPTSPTPAGPGA